MADWGREVCVLPSFPGHVLWHEEYLSFSDKLIQYYFRLLAHRFPFLEDPILTAHLGRHFFGSCHDGFLQGSFYLPWGEIRSGGRVTAQRKPWTGG